ncbi:transglutaminase domain-containing protein [Geminocystis sp.]|uniref:transglutaminase domain-containing protein n=1 Tax=Geminocystis sp. TaxID=2664100 RepID=UPI0035943FED
MATQREYQEWQKRKNQGKKRYKKNNNKNLTFVFWFGISILSILFAIKNQPQLVNKVSQTPQLIPILSFLNSLNLEVNSLKNLTQEFVTETDESVVVITNQKNFRDTTFQRIDNLAINVKYSGNSVKELANILSQYATTDEEKARIIYTWITHNISYDVVALANLFDKNIYPDVTTKNVLTTRSTICSGYANLYQQLAEYMGLKSVIVLGYSKGTNYVVGKDNQVNHSWNGVKIDGNWYLIDTTWGAGIVDNNQFIAEFNPFYFATKPEHFIYSHFPENPQWQLLTTPFSRAQFDTFPDISTALFDNNIQLISHQNLHIDTDNNLNVTLKAPKNIVAIANLKTGENELIENYTFVQKQGENINVNASFPEKGDYKLEIFAKPKDDSNNYPLIVSYEVSAEGKGNKFPVTFKHFSEHNGYLESPLSATLNENQNIYFKMRIKSAQEVKVVNQSTNQWHDLSKYGDVFAGNINIGSGKIMVFAKFPEDSRYWALLEYN